MPRSDLLALTLDDLTALTNRGVVKRAVKELEEGQVTCHIEESVPGDLTFVWSDGRESRLAAGNDLSHGECTCAAQGLCRCLIRAVLAYQRQQVSAGANMHSPQTAANQPAIGTDSHPENVPSALHDLNGWDPGQISDELLARLYSPAALNKARKQFEAGQLIELSRGAKPLAHFHVRSTTLRFLAPGDPRYVHCDCGEQPPCGCVPMAVWAYRRLPPELMAGLISCGQSVIDTPHELLDELEWQFRVLASEGLSRVAGAWRDRTARLEQRCRRQGLLWPADILVELFEVQQQYQTHDAQFDSLSLASLVGELLIRGDAIRSPNAEIPQPLIRGTASDRLTEMGAARLTGLGCAPIVRHQSVELVAYLQNTASGGSLAITRVFSDPTQDQSPPSFSQLARQSVSRGMSLAEIAAGHLLIKSGKRSANRRLMLGRGSAGLHPQEFSWEELRPPLLVDEFSAIDSLQRLLPPVSLRPRRITEGLHVLPIASVTEPRFEPAQQMVKATLLDVRGSAIELQHRYTSRGQAGCEALLRALQMAPERVRFVAGRIGSEGRQAKISPTCLVFETPQGRVGLQPWIADSLDEHLAATFAADLDPSEIAPTALREVAFWPAQLQAALGELLLLGLQHADGLLTQTWHRLAREGERQGYRQLSAMAAQLAAILDSQPAGLPEVPHTAVDLTLRLTAIARLAQDRW